MPYLIISADPVERLDVRSALEWLDNRLRIEETSDLEAAFEVLGARRPAAIFCGTVNGDVAEFLMRIRTISPGSAFIGYGKTFSDSLKVDFLLRAPVSKIELLQVINQIRQRKVESADYAALEPKRRIRRDKASPVGLAEVVIKWKSEPLKFSLPIRNGSTVADAIAQISKGEVLPLAIRRNGEELPAHGHLQLSSGDELIIDIKQNEHQDGNIAE